MIFPKLVIEPKVQVGDKTRLNAVSTFITPGYGTITAFEIKPGADKDFIDVSDTMFLDWAFDTEGEKEITVRVETSDGAESDPVIQSQTLTKIINVVTAAQDNLFSSDDALVVHEADILNWVEDGRNSFINFHRRARDLILDELDDRGYRSSSGSKLLPSEVPYTGDLRVWATFLCLELIFSNLSNAVDDVFDRKRTYYSKKKDQVSSRSYLRLDVDGDGVQDPYEGYNDYSCRIVHGG
jgi:hypothetical protein